jgi:hypothetical protein
MLNQFGRPLDCIKWDHGFKSILRYKVLVTMQFGHGKFVVTSANVMLYAR